MTLRSGKSILALQYALFIQVMQEQQQDDEIVKRLMANDIMIIDEVNHYPKPYNSKSRKSKGEKKRQRSEWNQSIRGHRK